MDGLNRSFDHDFIKESLKSANETNALSRLNDVAASRELALNNTAEIVTEHTRAVEEVTERALSQLHEGNLFQNIRNFFGSNPLITYPLVITLIGTIIQYRGPIMTIGRELFSNTNRDQVSNLVPNIEISPQLQSQLESQVETISQVESRLEGLVSQRDQILEGNTTTTEGIEILNVLTPGQAAGIGFFGLGLGLYLAQRGKINLLLKLLAKK